MLIFFCNFFLFIILFANLTAFGSLSIDTILAEVVFANIIAVIG